MKRIIFSIVNIILTLFLFWLGGFDFNERGEVAVICFLFSFAVGALSYTCPFIKDEQPPKDAE